MLRHDQLKRGSADLEMGHIGRELNHKVIFADFVWTKNSLRRTTLVLFLNYYGYNTLSGHSLSNGGLL